MILDVMDQYGSMYLRYEGIEEEIVSSIDQIPEFDWKALYVIVNVLSILGLSLKLKTIAIGIACLRFPPLCTWPLSIVLLLLPSYVVLALLTLFTVASNPSKQSAIPLISTARFFLGQFALVCIVNVGIVLYRFLLQRMTESPSSPLEMFSIHTLLGYDTEDFKAWLYCQVFLVCVPCVAVCIGAR